MNSGIKLKGKLVAYLVFPIIMGVIAFITGILGIVGGKHAAIGMVVAAVIYIIVSVILYFKSKPVVMSDFVKFAMNYAQVQKRLLKDLAIPYGLVDISGNIIWNNVELGNILEKTDNNENIFSDIIDLSKENVVLEEGEEKEADVVLCDRNYRILFKRINTEHIFDNTDIIESPIESEYLVAVYFFDETEIKALIKENNDEKFVSGLIYIDNYEEALQTVEDVRGSLLTALIDRRVNKFVANIEGVVKKIEKDKYFIAFKHKYLEILQADKFSILDEVKSVNVGNEMGFTISIAVGADGESYAQNTEYARMAMDMALGRGGDQAVVKAGEKIYYYGGKSKSVEKNTRVKARVKAHALREVLQTKDSVIIMGHQLQDIDSFGAAIGIYRASKSLGKRVNIVLNEVTSSLRPMLDRFISSDEYEEDLFVRNEEAMAMLDDNTTVVVVDVNRPSYTECPQLLQRSKSVVVLDHHRQTSEIIENAVLSYIEPFASSACEMVAEILQYIQDGIKIRPLDADAMYGGIMIDTNNFSNKTGVRTFEAAAFLRRCGADVTRVRMMFRNDISEYKARAQAVSRAEVFMEKFALSESDSYNLESPTIVAAQAANELLNINGIEASFVLTDYNEKVYISARSINKVNVQLIMEKIGGGGHMNIAGAQVENMEIDEVKNLIKQTIRQMIEEKEI